MKVKILKLSSNGQIHLKSQKLPFNFTCSDHLVCNGEIKIENNSFFKFTNLNFNSNYLNTQVNFIYKYLNIKGKLKGNLEDQSFNGILKYKKEKFEKFYIQVSKKNFSQRELIVNLESLNNSNKRTFKNMITNCTGIIDTNQIESKCRIQSEILLRPFISTLQVSDRFRYLKGEAHLNSKIDFNNLFKSTAKGTFKFKDSFIGKFNLEPLKYVKSENIDLNKEASKFKFHLFTEKLKFQFISKLLKNTKWAIPAPLHVLKGDISSEIVGNLGTDHFQFTNLYLDSNLSSKHQVASFHIMGNIDHDKRGNILSNEIQVYIRKLQLRLPPVDFLGDFSFLSSSKNIKLENEKKVTPPHQSNSKQILNSTTIRIKGSKNSIVLEHSAVKPGIVITPNLKITNRGISGTLNISPAKIEILHRKPEIKYIKLDFDSTNEKINVNSIFYVDQSFYRIYIEVAGSVQNYKIKLWSKPYLPHDDVVSMLLFGKLKSRLNEGQKQSTNEFLAAQVDNAIGFFSIWLFAGTPIRSLSYDPITERYGADFEILDNNILSIESKFENSMDLSIRRWLSQNWLLDLGLTKENDRNSADIELQWEKRF